MELCESASVVAVSADTSLELLMMQNLRGFEANLMEFEENIQPFLGVGLIGKLFCAMCMVEVEDDTAIGIRYN